MQGCGGGSQHQVDTQLKIWRFSAFQGGGSNLFEKFDVSFRTLPRNRTCIQTAVYNFMGFTDYLKPSLGYGPVVQVEAGIMERRCFPTVDKDLHLSNQPDWCSGWCPCPRWKLQSKLEARDLGLMISQHSATCTGWHQSALRSHVLVESLMVPCGVLPHVAYSFSSSLRTGSCFSFYRRLSL